MSGTHQNECPEGHEYFCPACRRRNDRLAELESREEGWRELVRQMQSDEVHRATHSGGGS